MFVVMPIVAVALVRLFELRPAFEIALVALAISPVPPLLPKKEGKAGGESGYGLGLMATVSLLAIALVPLSVGDPGTLFRAAAADAAGGRREGGRHHDAAAAHRRRDRSRDRSGDCRPPGEAGGLFATVLLAAAPGRCSSRRSR